MKPILALLALLLATSAFAAPKPLKVFILAGQSNMEGRAVVDLAGKDYNSGKGTLKTLMADPTKAAMFASARGTDGKWTVREDVISASVWRCWWGLGGRTARATGQPKATPWVSPARRYKP